MFKEFSDYSRIWIYGFERTLSSEEVKIVKSHLDNFINVWHSHKERVIGAYEILYNQFVILAAETSISGCSIDSSIHVFKKLKNEYQLNALNQNLVYYKDETGVSTLSRDEFQTLVDLDKINYETIVFNPTIYMLGVFRAGQWELPFYKSWHSLVFKKSAWTNTNIEAVENFKPRMTGT